MQDEPIALDVMNKMILFEKFGLSAKDVDNLSVEDVEAYLFIADTMNKKKELSFIR